MLEFDRKEIIDKLKLETNTFVKENIDITEQITRDGVNFIWN